MKARAAKMLEKRAREKRIERRRNSGRTRRSVIVTRD
jgi:hypothetical protein